MLIEERVFGESVVGDVCDSLQRPFFSAEDLRGDVGNLRDVSHSRSDALGVKVSADRWGKGGAGYKIGAFHELVEGFSHDAEEPPLGPIMTPKYSAEGTTKKLDHTGEKTDGSRDSLDTHRRLG